MDTPRSPLSSSTPVWLLGRPSLRGCSTAETHQSAGRHNCHRPSPLECLCVGGTSSTRQCTSRRHHDPAPCHGQHQLDAVSPSRRGTDCQSHIRSTKPLDMTTDREPSTVGLGGYLAQLDRATPIRPPRRHPSMRQPSYAAHTNESPQRKKHAKPRGTPPRARKYQSVTYPPPSPKRPSAAPRAGVLLTQ